MGKSWLIALLAALLLVGCRARAIDLLPSPVPAAPAAAAAATVPPLLARPTASGTDATPVVAGDDRIALARAEIARLRGELASALEQERSAVADRDDARREASLAPVRMSIAWATLVGVAVGGVATALLIASLIWSVPVGRRILGGIAGAGFGLAALAQGIGFALPWFGLVGIVALVLAVLVAAGLLVARLWPVLIAHAHLADVAEEAEDLADTALAKAKTIAAKAQARAGLDRAITTARRRRQADHR